jgi:hypothetical protein
MTNIESPGEDSDWNLPYKYNAYLIEKLKEINDKKKISSWKTSDLNYMYETGRISGEIIRSTYEYINLLKSEHKSMNAEYYNTANVPVMTYEEFIRDYKIENILD